MNSSSDYVHRRRLLVEMGFACLDCRSRQSEVIGIVNAPVPAISIGVNEDEVGQTVIVAVSCTDVPDQLTAMKAVHP
jgi:hypothetical protein